MTTRQDSFDERLTRLETEAVDVKNLLGDNAVVQAQMLNILNQIDQRIDNVDRRTEDIARHLGVPKPNGTA